MVSHQLLTTNRNNFNANFIVATVSSELQVFSTDNPDRVFDSSDRITVGNALDVAVEVKCSCSNDPLSGVNWTFGENGTAIPRRLKAFGTSQDERGVLRVYPANTLSPSGTRLQCWGQCGNENQTLNVTLELRKAFSHLFIAQL